LQHIDFPLPRKHKPALLIAIETAPLTTMAAQNEGRVAGRAATRRSPMIRCKFSGSK
jgi:hypothetical protein